MNNNPNCPGVPHRPECPHYRKAVERHFELGGVVEVRDNRIRPKWIAVSHHLMRLKFDKWDDDLEYRPAEPLCTDSHPEGLPDPGDGWRWVLKGEAVEPGDKEYAPISGVWVMLESPSVNNGSRMVRRRLASEQDYNETIETTRAAGGDSWDGVTDVDAKLREIRGDGKSVPTYDQLDAIVRRLAKLRDAETMEDCFAELDQLMKEAREVCGE